MDQQSFGLELADSSTSNAQKKNGNEQSDRLFVANESDLHDSKVDTKILQQLQQQQQQQEGIHQEMNVTKQTSTKPGSANGETPATLTLASKSGTNNVPDLSVSPPKEFPIRIRTRSGSLSKSPGHSRNSTAVSLKDIVQQSPLECEAETYILKALESDHITNEAQQTILGGVPHEISHNFSDPVERKAELVVTNKNVHSKNPPTSTADDLCILTADLMAMRQSQTQQNNNNILSEEIIGNSSDNLVRNAALLMKRHRSQKVNLSSIEEEEVPPPTSTAASKWKKVRVAVQVSAAVRASADANTIGGKVKDTPEKTGLVCTDVEEGNVTPSDEGKKGNQSSEHRTDIHPSFPSERNSHKRKQGKVRMAAGQVKVGFQDFEDWVKYKKTNIYSYMKFLLFLVISATGVSAMLFYLFENPPCGTLEECYANHLEQFNKTASKLQVNITEDAMIDLRNWFVNDGDEITSVSWWILFVCVRHAVVFSLAGATQAFIIEFLCIRTRTMLRVAGPTITLFVVQSKGWPFMLQFWAIYAAAILYGDNRFAKHWLFWQDTIELFNETNPSGSTTSHPSYKSLIILALVIGLVVSIKRLWVGLFMGRQTFSRYASDLATLMRKVLLIGQVASVARDIEQNGYIFSDINMNREIFHKSGFDFDIEPTLSAQKSVDNDSHFGEEQVFGFRKDFSGSSARIKIEKLLGEWEEPKDMSKKDEKISISSIIQFRTSLACLNTSVPFSSAFGMASKRLECIESSESLFRRLLLATPGENSLFFDVIALVAVDGAGELDETKVKELIKLFRPDREGYLSLLDFVKSIDTVYKELRLLRASVINSLRMDRAFERIINLIFYFILGCIVLAVFGVDPLVLFASISGFILGFTFMIGAACSKYFEGLLFVLLRRPYDIGDRIHVSDPNSETKSTGSSTWFVRDVDLFTTTVCFASTNEVATYSNGSLAASRIINAARSPEASISFNLKFPTSASYEKLQVFKAALEEFVKARPREYLSFSGFRCSRVEADLGYVEYSVCVSHRESWQNVRALVDSKAELSSFALELSKQMDLRYVAPAMPIDLRLSMAAMNAFGINPNNVEKTEEIGIEGETVTPGESNISAVTAMFDKNK